MPEALSERVMNALKADPRTVDLRALAPHFYNLSERILEIFEEEDMVDVLSDVGVTGLWTTPGVTANNCLILDLQETGGRNRRPRAQPAWCRGRGREFPPRVRRDRAAMYVHGPK